MVAVKPLITGLSPSRGANRCTIAAMLPAALESLDEMRAEYVPRSAAWIQACYVNQGAPATFQSGSAIFARAIDADSRSESGRPALTSSARSASDHS